MHESAPNFRRHAIDSLESMGISVEFSHHEGAPGQQEIDLRYADALSMADNVMTFRYLIKEVAIDEGVRATFMPKPFSEHPGSAMHTHMSLFEGEANAFADPDDPNNLSEIARAFIAGILEHARDQRGHQPVGELLQAARARRRGADRGVLGRANRSALVRVPMYTPNKSSSRRVEIRSPDSACNPYLTFAVLLAAGLRGVEKGYTLPPEAEDDVWALTLAERRAMGFKELPASLDEALEVMERSELVAETLGEHVFDFFLRNKRREWADTAAGDTVRAEDLPVAVVRVPRRGPGIGSVTENRRVPARHEARTISRDRIFGAAWYGPRLPAPRARCRPARPSRRQAITARAGLEHRKCSPAVGAVPLTRRGSGADDPDPAA